MEHHVDERDFRLLEADKYTFAVLARILRGNCDLVLSDHASFILCHSAEPHPVWVWMPDGISEEAKEIAWNVSQNARALASGYRYNIKYELAEYFITRAKAEGHTAKISTNLYAYDCPSPLPPHYTANGMCACCNEADADELTAMIKCFHDDIGDCFEMEACRKLVEQHIANQRLFKWTNNEGEIVACCTYGIDNNLAYLGNVYTKPEHRRKHYAQNLVYRVTRLVHERGYMPMLYTDADYAASNACYEKIGYKLRGKLCTLSAE